MIKIADQQFKIRSLVYMIHTDDGRKKRDYVQKIWTDPAHPVSFAGPEKVYQIIRKEGGYTIGLGTIKNILSNKETYTVHKPARQTSLEVG